jgi:hypothetical protein
MTPGGWSFPSGRALATWHRRFPDGRLWAGHLLLWRVELPVRSHVGLSEWVARATALGSSRPADLAVRLGLPEPVVASLLAEANSPRINRRSFAFLDLPGGQFAVPVPTAAHAPWPESIPPERVPRSVIQSVGVEVPPVTNDWRTVPVVGPQRFAIGAVHRDGRITVYPADAGWSLGDAVLSDLPGDAMPSADPGAWAAAWRAWCAANGLGKEAASADVAVASGVARVGAVAVSRIAEVARGEAWLLVGDGPLREAAVIQLRGSP